MFALSDRAYSKQSPESTITSLQASCSYNPTQSQHMQNRHISDSLSDFCSTSLIDLLQNRRPEAFSDNSKDLSSESITFNDENHDVKVTTVTLGEYMSEALAAKRHGITKTQDTAGNSSQRNFSEYLSQFSKSDKSRRATDSQSVVRETKRNPEMSFLNVSQPLLDRQSNWHNDNKNESEFQFEMVEKPKKIVDMQIPNCRTTQNQSVILDTRRNPENPGYLNSSQQALVPRSKWHELCDRSEEKFQYKPIPNACFQNWRDKENVMLNNTVPCSYDYENIQEELMPYRQPLYIQPPSQSFEKHWSNESVISAEHSVPCRSFRNSSIYPPRSYQSQQYSQPFTQPFPTNSYHR